MARLRRPSRANPSSSSSSTASRRTTTRALRPRHSSPIRASRLRMREDASDTDSSDLLDHDDDDDDDDDEDEDDNHSDAPSDIDSSHETLPSSPVRRRGPGRPRSTRPNTKPPSRSNSTATNKQTTKGPRPRGRPSLAAQAKRPASNSPHGYGSSTPTKRPKIQVCLPQRHPRIPPWTDSRIPYDAWVAIFSYASNHVSNGWLVDCSTICKAFLEPSLTALYRRPFPSTTPRLKRMVELLKRDPADTIINYRTKIESLTLDVKHTPAAVYFPLIHPLPRLKELLIVTSLDRPPYRDLDVTLRWTYLDDIFQALKAGLDTSESSEADPGTHVPAVIDGSEASEAPASPTAAVAPAQEFLTRDGKPFATALRSWEWSGRMFGGAVPSIHDLPSMHQMPFFQSLTTLSFTNLQTPSMLRLASSSASREPAAENADTQAAQAVATAISHLGSLRHLIFEACTIMDHILLPLLPTNLQHLTLINCWEVRSDIFATFLHTHGRHLLSLTLSHCQSLNLEFLTSLGSACPDLRELSMDLSYYRLHNSVNDSDPMYDYVLLPDQIPDWPSTLRMLDLDNIKDCPADTAKMFLSSLLDSAQRLKDLRHIAIKMMLNIPWQDRAKMRNEWRQTMEDVFLRRSAPPIEWAAADAHYEVDEEPIARKRKASRRASPARRSGRLSTKGRGSRNDSKRLRHKDGRMDYRDPDTDHDDVSETDKEEESADTGGTGSDDEEDDERSHAQFIHGMCDTVSVLFDNLKPMEMQYGMEDFHDDDTDSQEEWNGDDDEEDETVFVWR